MSPTALSDLGRDQLLETIRASLGERTDVSDEEILRQLRARASRIEAGEFSRLIRQARLDFLRLNEKEAQAFSKMLGKAYEDTVAWYERRVARSSGFRYEELAAVRDDIGAIMREFAQEYRKELGDAIAGSTGIATDRMKAMSEAYAAKLPDEAATGGRNVMVALSSRANRATIDAMWSRVTAADGLTLTNRIWNLERYGTRQIADVVGSALLNGKSAVDLSRDLEPFLLPGQRGPVWTTRPAPAKVLRNPAGDTYSRGTVSYNALRLARTEMRLAQQEAHARNVQLLQEQGLSYVVGIKWNLSTSHSELDDCDVYAAESSDGLPPGVYQPADVPTSHPNCWCFTTDDLVPPEVFAEQMADIGPSNIQQIADAVERFGFGPRVTSPEPAIPPAEPVPEAAPEEPDDSGEAMGWTEAASQGEAEQWAEENLANSADYSGLDLTMMNAVNKRMAENMTDLGLDRLSEIRTRYARGWRAAASPDGLMISSVEARSVRQLAIADGKMRAKYARNAARLDGLIDSASEQLKASRAVRRLLAKSAPTWEQFLSELRRGPIASAEEPLLRATGSVPSTGPIDAVTVQRLSDRLKSAEATGARQIREWRVASEMKGFTYTLPKRGAETLVDHETGHLLYYQLGRTAQGRAILAKYDVENWTVHGKTTRMLQWAARISEYAYMGNFKYERFHETLAEMFAVWRQGKDRSLLPRKAIQFFEEAVAYLLSLR